VVKERVELHLYFPSGCSWPVLGFTFSFAVRNTQGDIRALVSAINEIVELYNAAHFCHEVLYFTFFLNLLYVLIVGVECYCCTGSHSLTHTHTAGLLSTRDRPAADNQSNSEESDIPASGGIRTHNPSKRAAADPRLRPRGYWDRQYCSYAEEKLNLKL